MVQEQARTLKVPLGLLLELRHQLAESGGPQQVPTGSPKGDRATPPDPPQPPIAGRESLERASGNPQLAITSVEGKRGEATPRAPRQETRAGRESLERASGEPVGLGARAGLSRLASGGPEGGRSGKETGPRGPHVQEGELAGEDADDMVGDKEAGEGKGVEEDEEEEEEEAAATEGPEGMWWDDIIAARVAPPIRRFNFGAAHVVKVADPSRALAPSPRSFLLIVFFPPLLDPE